jgi:hypothetical protein
MLPTLSSRYLASARIVNRQTRRLADVTSVTWLRFRSGAISYLVTVALELVPETLRRHLRVRRPALRCRMSS